MQVWFGWLSYAQPVSFAFEALMANEFRTLNVPCSQLIPSGVGYETVDVANQICATVGAVAGEAIVSGSQYLFLSFGYTYVRLRIELISTTVH
jgi:ABC-type multidrug transport system permease subunit